MKSIVANNSNSIFKKIKADILNLVDMIKSLPTNNTENKYDEIRDNYMNSKTDDASTIEQNLKTIDILENHNRKLDTDAQNFENSIGVPSRTKEQEHIQLNKKSKNFIVSTSKNEERSIENNSKKGFERDD